MTTTNSDANNRLELARDVYSEIVVDSLRQPVVVMGPQYDIRFANKATCRLTGLSPTAIIGRKCYELVVEGEKLCPHKDEDCPVRRTFATGAPSSIVRALQFAGIDKGFFVIQATPIFDQAGKVQEVVEILHPIDQKQLADKLSAQHRQLREVFATVEQAKNEWEMTVDCVQDSVLLTDAGGRVQRCNKSFVALLGCAYEQVVGRQWQKLLQAQHVDLHGIGPGQDGSTEVFHPGSGRTFILQLYSSADRKRGFVGFVITLHDITVQKRITAQLEEKNDELHQAYGELKRSQAQMLQQEKMASIGVLAAGIAHEINNPTSYVASNLSTMARYISRLAAFIDRQSEALVRCGNADEIAAVTRARQEAKIDFLLADSRELIMESLEGTGRVRSIVQDLKGFSRVDKPERSYADLNECLESTINIAWNELKYKVELVRDYGRLPEIECYPQQLNQVFMNLLVNACQAIADHGTITITTRQVAGALEVTIADTGCGIDAADLPRIFEPFFTTKEVGQGTGLGLSIVYDIITNNHGGEIDVTSEPGVGTTFTIRLPVVVDSA